MPRSYFQASVLSEHEEISNSGEATEPIRRICSTSLNGCQYGVTFPRGCTGIFPLQYSSNQDSSRSFPFSDLIGTIDTIVYLKREDIFFVAVCSFEEDNVRI